MGLEWNNSRINALNHFLGGAWPWLPDECKQKANGMDGHRDTKIFTHFRMLHSPRPTKKAA
jgi:hypothetical protein